MVRVAGRSHFGVFLRVALALSIAFSFTFSGAIRTPPVAAAGASSNWTRIEEKRWPVFPNNLGIATRIDGHGNRYVIRDTSIVSNYNQFDLSKIDPKGLVQWTVRLPFAGPAKPTLECDAVGNLYASGESGAAGEFRVVRLEPNDGQTLWQREFAGFDVNIPASITVDHGGEYLYMAANGDSFASIYRIATADGVAWKVVDTAKSVLAGSSMCRILDVSAEATGCLYAVGTVRGQLVGSDRASTDAFQDYAVIKYDYDGRLVWSEQSYTAESLTTVIGAPVACKVAVDRRNGVPYVLVNEYPENQWEGLRGSRWYLMQFMPDNGYSSGGIRLSTASGGRSTASGLYVDPGQSGLAVDEGGRVYAAVQDVDDIYPNGTYTLSAKLVTYGWADGYAETEVSPSEPTARMTVEDVSCGGGYVYVTGSAMDPLDGPQSAKDDYGAYWAKYAGGDFDSDGDALPDRWEIEGYTDPKTGKLVDLPKMGADPRHKDVFVEIDYMENRKPDVDALYRVVEAFANADQVTNPDGKTGISLHLDLGADTTMTPSGDKWGGESRSDQIAFKEEVEIKEKPDAFVNDDFPKLKGSPESPGNFTPERWTIFRYCIWANWQKQAIHSTTGQASDIPGSDMLITLGPDPTGAQEQAGTFMHELGHLLGLKHGGQDHINYKPNYLSIMNYSFVDIGLGKRAGSADIWGLLDYSRYGADDLLTLDEKALDEAQGMMASTPDAAVGEYLTRFYKRPWTDSDSMQETSTVGPKDWNLNNRIDSGTIQKNLNADGWWVLNSDGTWKLFDTDVLQAFEDWRNIRFRGGAVGGRVIASGWQLIADPSPCPPHPTLPVPYNVVVQAPPAIGLSPGQSISRTFTVQNTGTSDDTYSLAVDSPAGWADASAVPAQITLKAGEMKVVDVPVAVPISATVGDFDDVALTASSASRDLLKATSSGTVACAEQSDITQVDLTASFEETSNPWIFRNEQYSSLPVLDDGRIVYIGGYYDWWEGSGEHTWLYDVKTKTRRELEFPRASTAWGNEVLIDLDGAQLLSRDIHDAAQVFNVDTGAMQAVVGMPSSWEPSKISGDRVYGLESTSTPIGNQTIITAYDLSSAKREVVVGDFVVGFDVDGDRLAYITAPTTDQNLPSEIQLRVRDLATGDDTLVPNPVVNGQERYAGGRPVICGSKIACVDYLASFTDWGYMSYWQYWKPRLVVRDIATGGTSEVQQVPSGTSILRMGIGDQLLAWVESQGTYSNRVMVYDMVVGTARELSPPAEDSNYRTAPQVDGGTVVYAVDGLTGPGSFYSFDWTYVANVPTGSVAPVTSAAIVPADPATNGWYSTTPTVTLSPDQPNALTYYQFDATDPAGWVTYASPFSVPDGDHTLHYYSADRIGNKEAPKSIAVKVDTTAPQTDVEVTGGVTTFGTGIYREPPAVTLVPDEPATSYYQWDGTDAGSWSTYSAALTPLEGIHTLFTYSEDARGNAEEPTSRQFWVDTAADSVAPTVTVEATPAADAGGVFRERPRIDLSADETATIYFQWDSAVGLDDPPSEPLRAPGALVPGQPGRYLGGDGWSRYLGTLHTPEGKHTLHYYAVDVAGNRSEIGSLEVDVQLPPPPENVAPILAPIGDKTVAEGSELALTLHATDANGDVVSYEAAGVPDGATLDALTGEFRWTPGFEQAGEYVVTFGATDGEFTSARTITITVTETNRPPVASDVLTATTTGKPVTVTLTAADPDGDSLTWLGVPAIAPTAGVVSGAPPTITYTPKAGFVGTDVFAYSVSDGRGGTATARVTMTVKAAPVTGPSVRRITGGDRYQVALNSSRSTFPAGKVSRVVLAGGSGWTNALAASGLAGTLRSPILLTGAESLPTGLVTELRRLGAKRVYVVGSTAAVSTRVTSRLKSAGLAVTRISGSDRYELAKNIALKIEDIRGENRVSKAIVVRGDAFYDALSVSAVAYNRKMPVLYTPPWRLDADTSAAIRALDIDEVIIGGGKEAVQPRVARAIDGLRSVDKVTRWGGDDRVATAVAINNGAYRRGWQKYTFVGTTSCQSYADGLSASSATGYRSGTLLPVTYASVPTGTKNLLAAHKSEIKALWVFGRRSAVSDAVVVRLRRIIE